MKHYKIPVSGECFSTLSAQHSEDLPDNTQGHTHAHACLSLVERTLTDIMHFLAPYPKINHPSQLVDKPQLT